MAKEEMDFMAMFGQAQDSELPSEVNFDEFTEVDVSNPFFDTETADEAVSGGAANVDNDAADSAGASGNEKDCGITEAQSETNADSGESEKTVETTAVNKPADSAESKAKAEPVQAESGKAAKAEKKEDFVNPFEAELERVETAEAEKVKTGLLNKPPIFEFAGAKDEISDTEMTFEAIREEKAEDFPELEDANRVSWKMVYAGITKQVSTPKKTTVAQQKKLIEDSKDFTKALKNKKADFVCKIIPTVIAQKKGRIPAYMGIYADMEQAEAGGKAISFIPGDDGNIYERRQNSIGTFVARADKVRGLSSIKAGFIPALPRLSFETLSKIIAFFKRYSDTNGGLEALVNVYWDVENKKYIVNLPAQRVGKAYVETKLDDHDDNLVHVMDIHSHNTMKASFSAIDDADEKATRIYAVIGRLDKYLPDITARISVGGKFVEIPPSSVFEYPFNSTLQDMRIITVHVAVYKSAASNQA